MTDYREIRSLKPEDQERATELLRDRGALTTSPATQDPSVLWCGHPRDAIVKDGDIEYCPECSDE